MKLVLVNAIYLQSRWKFPFDPEDTYRAPFYTTTELLQVDMMTVNDEFAYADLPELRARIVSVPYKSLKTATDHRGRFSMHVIIPKQTFGLARVLKALRYTTMDDLRKNIKKPSLCEEVVLHLPKFKIESTLDLAQPLMQVRSKGSCCTHCWKI